LTTIWRASHRRGHWFEPSIAHPSQRPDLLDREAGIGKHRDKRVP
jgi:hypothetical protein